MAELFPHGPELNSESSAPPAPAVGKVRLWVGGQGRRGQPNTRPPSPWWLRWLMGLLTGSGLLGGLALLVVSFRWGLLLILNPDALPRVQSVVLAPFAPQPLATTTTRAALQQSVTASGQSLGTPLKLAGTGQEPDWLMVPILAAESGKVVKIHLFQQVLGPQAEEQLIDVAELTVPPFSVEAILAPLPPKQRLSKVLPKEFTAHRLALLPSPPSPSPYHWLTLEGQWSQQGSRLRYGQIVVFDPERRSLNLAEVWSSPVEQIPQWADLDGEGLTDLIVDETTGMDPVLRGLRLIDRRGLGPAVQLQPVSWVGMPVDAGAAANRYQKALRLARGGLWQEAHTLLQDLKATLAEQWTPAAEAQLRLTARHAAISQRQADQDWSMPTQKIMALLIDGQWEAALAQLETSPARLEPLMRRLAADQGRLWNRISAAASLPDPEAAVFVWGGLMLEAQQNRQAAQNWLARQPVSRASRDRLTAMLTTQDSPSQPSAGNASSVMTEDPVRDDAVKQTANAPTLVQGVIGQAAPIEAVPSDYWYVPDQQLPVLTREEQWYVVEVPLVRHDRRWQSTWPQLAVEPMTAELLWPMLPFAEHPSMTMVDWESSTSGVSQNLAVKGLSIHDGSVQLLAVGATATKSAFPPLAYSDGALVWLVTNTPTTPAGHRVMTPLMDHIMRHHGPLPEQVGAYALGALLQEVQLHTLDLTGDGRLEQVLTFDPATLDQLQGLGIKLDRTAHKTVILTEDNQLIYSDLFQPQTLIALTNPRDGLPLSLVVHRSSGYGLWQWSADNQEFQP